MSEESSLSGAESEHEGIRTAVILGAELAGGGAGGILGFLLGGPVGAAGAGAAGALITRCLVAAGEEVCDRILSPREQARVGAALAVSAAKTMERLEKGDRVRDDGFVSDGTARPPLEEVTEGLLLAAQRAYDEKKVPFIGRLSANLNFRPDLDVQSASFLVRMADTLSYQQLCLLRICHDNGAGKELKGGKPDGHVKSAAHAALLSDLLELERQGFISNGGVAVLGLGDINPPGARLQVFGVHLFDLMELNLIPNEDLVPLRQTFETPAPTFVTSTRNLETELENTHRDTSLTGTGSSLEFFNPFWGDGAFDR